MDSPTDGIGNPALFIDSNWVWSGEIIHNAEPPFWESGFWCSREPGVSFGSGRELPGAPKLFQKLFARILQRHRESENRRSKLSVPPRWPGRSLTGVHGNPAPKPRVEPALVIDVYASECLLACSITRPLSLCIPR